MMEVKPTLENIINVDDVCLMFSEWVKALKTEDGKLIERSNKTLVDLHNTYWKFNNSRLARQVRRLRFYKYTNSEIYNKLNKKR